MKNDLWIIDAFTSVPFRGNAAAVLVLNEFPSDDEMQMTALLANLSETAFVVPTDKNTFNLRWFTPKVEVDLCGHATLATSHTLRQMGFAKQSDTLTFNTKSGELKARLKDDGSIELDFPLEAGNPVEADPAFKALGVKILHTERNATNDLVEVKNFDTLIDCKPNFKKLGEMEMQGVIVTTATGVPEGFDFASRYFGPNCGINEDPVTGSAHTFLAPYWAERLGKTEFRAFQASIGKGELDVALKGDDRVLIGGKCVTSIRGEIPKLKLLEAV